MCGCQVRTGRNKKKKKDIFQIREMEFGKLDANISSYFFPQGMVLNLFKDL